MGDEDDELLTRIGPNGEIQYGYPINQEDGEMLELVAEIEGISWDEATNLLMKIGMAGVLREMEASNKFPQDTIDKIRSNLQ
jgi:hypothetical protein